MPITLIITLSIAYVAVGVGLWKTRSWAWKGALAFVVVGIVTSLVQGVLGLPIAVLLLLVGIYLVLRREVFTDKPVPPSPQQ
ncbi:hypothetical protein C488_14802 [Natrinema pellirubrum DSM 15624]|nr:hypothetical protein C488_14802 [Natrinema pellirubrum DSM 15624]